MRKRIFRIAVVFLAVVASVLPMSGILAATTATVTITATPEYLAITISNDPVTWAIGAVAESTTKWWTTDGNAPSPEPFEDADMKETLTNTGSIASNIKVHGHAFTGGVGWTLSADLTPAGDEVAISVGFTGTTNVAAMTLLALTDSSPTEVHEIAASGTKKVCMNLITGTFTDGVAKSSTVTFTIEKHT